MGRVPRPPVNVSQQRCRSSRPEGAAANWDARDFGGKARASSRRRRVVPAARRSATRALTVIDSDPCRQPVPLLE